MNACVDDGVGACCGVEELHTLVVHIIITIRVNIWLYSVVV